MKVYNKMQQTGFLLFGGAVLLSLTGIAAGCSDNTESGLYAAEGNNIEIKAEASGFSNGLLSIASALQSPVEVTVSSTTRWTVEVTDCEGAWCQIVYGESATEDKSNIGDGFFSIDAVPNRGQQPRECNVTVYAIYKDGTHIPGKSIVMHLVQDAQTIQVDYASDVISYLGTSTGNIPTVTVKANQSWTVSSSHSWVKIVPGPDMNGETYETDNSVEKSVSFQINVEGNPGTSVRNAEITISSPISAFTPHRLSVVQEGSTDTFFITPTEVPYISFEGEIIEFKVYSPREKWSVTSISEPKDGWLTLDRTSGDPSPDPVTVKATIPRNAGGASREGSVVFKRNDSKMAETVVRIKQDADPSLPQPDLTPQVSAPWLATGWSSEFARLSAYFSSQRYEISSCGVCYRSQTNANDQGNVSGKHEGNIITAEITTMNYGTTYEAWAYLRYTLEGDTLESRGPSIYFTTPAISGEPAVEPGEGDNIPPLPNN